MNQSARNRLLAGTFVLFAARLVLSLIRTGPRPLEHLRPALRHRAARGRGPDRGGTGRHPRRLPAAPRFRAGNARAYGVIAIGLFLAVVAYGAWNPVHSSQRGVYPAGWESPRAAVEDAGGMTVAYDLDDYDTIGLYAVQWFLPDSKILLFEGQREAPPARLVISNGEWAQEHRAVPAKLLWSDPGRDQSLWRLGGPCPDAGC